MKSLKSFIFGSKAVPYIDVISEDTREGLNKAFIPKFLYRPPFGFPRFANIDYVRFLAKTPYVEMCIDTILKEIASIDWDIVPNPDIPERIGDGLFYEEDGSFKPEVEAEINHIKSFLENPNTNKESFEDIFVKMAYRDVLEVNTGVVNKVYNLKQEMVELVARDGATFTKNPDIHGMFTDRAEILIPKKIIESEGEAVNPFQHISMNVAREKGAYFQYGWISGPVPVPFGKREIIWLQNMLRSDDIYGYSPVQLLAKSLQMLLYHIESDLEYYNDNNVPKGVIGIDASDSDEIKSFKKQWYDAQRTKDEFGNWKKLQHKVPILNYIPKFERIEFSSEEIQLIEKQKWYSKMVWACFGVTATELGYTEDGQGVSNQIVQSKVFKKKAINPALRMLKNHINREVLSEFEYIVDVPTGHKKLPMPKYVFKFNTFDIDDEKAKAELHKIWIETGRKTINEIRIMEGETPLEWGDKAPKNMQNSNNFYMGGRDEESDFDEFDFETSEPMNKDENLERNETRVSNQKSAKKKSKQFINEIKHKYRSRKRVGNKWVYDYGDKKPQGSHFERNKEKLHKLAEKYSAEVKPKDREVVNKSVDAMVNKKDSFHINQKDGKWDSKRQSLHNKVMKNYIDDAKEAVSTEPKVIFMAGLPASGKTYSVKNQFEEIKGTHLMRDKNTGEKYLVLNSDDIKQELPEYENGAGAAFVHEESSYLNKVLINGLSDKKVNIIVDGTFKTANSARKLQSKFKEKDYKTSLFYIDVRHELSLQRAKQRYEKTGRYVPYSFITGIGDKISNTVDELKGNFDTFKHIDNNGSVPKVVQ